MRIVILATKAIVLSVDKIFRQNMRLRRLMQFIATVESVPKNNLRLMQKNRYLISKYCEIHCTMFLIA